MATVEEILIKFGSDLAADFETSLIKALAEGGRKSPQTTKLNFHPKLIIDGPDVTVQILASGKYWEWIESGRAPKEKRVPADKLGKKWQNENGMDARSIILNIKAKKKHGLNYVPRKFKKLKKTLDYDKAAKTLSFIIQNSIYTKGIKPKPFIDRVLEDGRVEILAATLKTALGDKFKLEITELQKSVKPT